MNSEQSSRCPECGALLPSGRTCDDLMRQVAEWEREDPGVKSADHHLLVLCWELQHPDRFSEEALAWANVAVSRALSEGLSAQQLRRQVMMPPESKPVMVTPGHPDSEPHPLAVAPPRSRPKTLADVVAEGPDALPGSVRRWAESVAADLKARGV